MREFGDLVEFAAAAGERLGESSWHEVTQHQVDLFAGATGDRQWIHVDPARAADGPFGGTIAHGYLMLSLIPRLLEEIYRVDRVGVVVNTSVDELRFVSVVPVGASVRLVAELASVQPRARGAIEVGIAATVEIRDRAKPACAARIGFIMRPAPPADAASRAASPADAASRPASSTDVVSVTVSAVSGVREA